MLNCYFLVYLCNATSKQSLLYKALEIKTATTPMKPVNIWLNSIKWFYSLNPFTFGSTFRCCPSMRKVSDTVKRTPKYLENQSGTYELHVHTSHVCTIGIKNGIKIWFQLHLENVEMELTWIRISSRWSHICVLCDVFTLISNSCFRVWSVVVGRVWWILRG